MQIEGKASTSQDNTMQRNPITQTLTQTMTQTLNLTQTQTRTRSRTQTRNPKPETRNPKPETRNPRPETQTRTRKKRQHQPQRLVLGKVGSCLKRWHSEFVLETMPFRRYNIPLLNFNPERLCRSRVRLRVGCSDRGSVRVM